MHVTARGQPEVLHLSFGDRLLSLDLSHEASEAGWLESPEETWLKLPSTEIVSVYHHVWIFLSVDSGGTRLRSFCEYSKNFIDGATPAHFALQPEKQF